MQAWRAAQTPGYKALNILGQDQSCKCCPTNAYQLLTLPTWLILLFCWLSCSQPAKHSLTDPSCSIRTTETCSNRSFSSIRGGIWSAVCYLSILPALMFDLRLCDLCNTAQKKFPACYKLSFQNASEEGIREEVKKRKMKNWKNEKWLGQKNQILLQLADVALQPLQISKFFLATRKLSLFYQDTCTQKANKHQHLIKIIYSGLFFQNAYHM